MKCYSEYPTVGGGETHLMSHWVIYSADLFKWLINSETKQVNSSLWMNYWFGQNAYSFSI